MKTLPSETVMLVVVSTLLCGCGVREVDQRDVQRYFSTHRVGSSPDYAIMKNGTDHLITIHGYSDDRAVCLQIIEPYNKDSSLSVFPGTYSCVPLN